jgi:hypothetical protein
MATSIRDLLDTLDLELAADPGEPVTAGKDAARLLKIAVPMLDRLARAGLDPLADGQRGLARGALPLRVSKPRKRSLLAMADAAIYWAPRATLSNCERANSHEATAAISALRS